MVCSFFVVLVFVVCFVVVLLFNLDIKDFFVYEGSLGEYFGYIVVLYV